MQTATDNPGQSIHPDAMRVRRGARIMHKRATYHVFKVNTVQDMDDLGQHAVAAALRERGQWAYAMARRGTGARRGPRTHLFRVFFDGTTAWEQAI